MNGGTFHDRGRQIHYRQMIFVVDNYDSFTYNLVQYLGQCGAEVIVRRNNETTLAEILAERPTGIMLSPGPCTPTESGVCLDIVSAALAADSPLAGIPVFGVCLGHQALGHVGGGSVVRADQPRHGKASEIEHDGHGVFTGVPSPFRAIRYHSLVIDKIRVPDGFEISARAQDDGAIMGIRHQTLPIEGVQFHPESILTEHGMTIIQNFVRATRPPV